MPRYRLRFLLQEFDLTGSAVTIGRSPECDVTIDDPLVSRDHARIELKDDGPVIIDTHSRNGVMLNDQPLIHKAVLEDGDRLCIGTQQLVFVASSKKGLKRRTTGSITFCQECRTPHPSKTPRCPHCGIAQTSSGETTAVKEVTGATWTFGLLRDVVERALEQGRYADAERMLKRGTRELEAQIEKGADLDAEQVSGIAECATRLGNALESDFWASCGKRLYEHAGVTPPEPKSRPPRVQGI